jgi:hypothetical protein
MGRFAGLGGIKTNQGGLHFQPGDYLVEIDEIKFLKNRKGQDCFIVGAKVLESSNPERAPGCRPSQVVVLRSDILETAWGNIKQFAGAIMGLEDPDSYVPEDGTSIDDFWDQALEFMVADEQPMEGAKIHLNCTNIKTKAGNDFTKHIWGPLVSMPEAA